MKRSRLLLIVFLVPIVLGIFTVALWELPSARTQVVFTPDGRLVGVDYERTLGVSRDLRIWDLTNRRMLLSRKTMPRQVLLSPDGNSLLLETDHVLSILDLQSGEYVADERILTSPPAVSFSPNGLFFAAMDGGEVWVREIAGWREKGRVTVDPALTSITVSNDGTMVAVGLATGKIDVWDVVAGKRALTLTGHTAGPSALAFAPDGRHLASLNGELKIWDIVTATELVSHTLNTRIRMVVFSPNSQRLAVLEATGRLAVISSDQNQQFGWFDLDIWALGMDFLADNETVVVVGDDRTVLMWNPETGAQRRMQMVSVGFILTSLLVSLAFATWSIFWVRHGLTDANPYRPFLDLLLLWTIGFVWLALRVFGTGSMYDVARESQQLGAACFFSSLALIVIWSALGTARWSLRAPGMIGMSAMAMAPMLLWEQFDWFLWQAVIGVLTLILTLFVLLKIWTVLSGCQLAQIASVESPAAGPPDVAFQSQFPLRDLLLWTTAAAVSVAVAMHLKPIALPRHLWIFIMVDSVGHAFVAAVSCWAAWSNRIWAIRLLLLALAAVLSGSMQLLFDDLNLVAPRWDAMKPVIMALLLTSSLLVFRLHGYRFVGRDERFGASR